FLSRLLHYDRGAAVRLQAAGTALAVFGRPPSFEVLAIRAVRLAKPYEKGLDVTLDVTVSAGELLETVDESGATAGVPAAVYGPRTRHSRSGSSGSRRVRGTWHWSRRVPGCGCARRTGRLPYGVRDLEPWTSASGSRPVAGSLIVRSPGYPTSGHSAAVRPKP